MVSLRFLAAFFVCSVFLVESASAALLARWTADTYVSGGNWTDSAAATPIVASPRNSPVAVPNAFGSHMGIDLSGGKYFFVPAARNVLGGKSSFTLAAVFRPSAPGTTGGNWYQASGLIGMEQGGVVNDFGFGWTGDGGGAVKAGLGVAGSSDPVVTSPAVALNTTHAAVFTYNAPSRALTLFVDGQQVASTTSSSSATGRNMSDFALGAITSVGGNPFPGLVAELQIYDTVEDGAALTSSLLTTYLPPKLITSFVSTPPAAFEGAPVQLSWTIDTTPTNGNISVTITRGATTIYSGSAANGNTSTAIPDLAGIAQGITYTLTVMEIGGNNYTNTANVVVQSDPGIPVVASQNGLLVPQPNPLAIVLDGTDPNGGTLTYTLVAPPAKGTLSIAGNSATYTPNAGANGADSFTVKATDGKYDSAPAKVSVTINPPAAAPMGITLDSTVVPEVATSGAFIANIGSSDVNFNDAHTFTLVPGAGATDNARFSVSDHQLRAAQSFAGLAGQTFSIRLRSTDSSGQFVEQIFALRAAATTRGVVINEVHYNGVDNTVRNEFIELYNAGTTTVTLTGWRLSSAVDYTFPANTTLDAGAYLLIAEDPPTIATKFGKTALGPWSGSLSGKGDTIRLRDAADVVVSEVDYKIGFPWPTASAGDGASIELLNPALDESLGGNWRAAGIPSPTATTDIASPGAQNLQFATNAPPAIRQVQHTPLQPTGGEPIVITAKVTDRDGVSSVNLLYQVVAPGAFIPSTLPKTISGGGFVNATTPLAANPAFENAANWTSVAMNDDGLGDDAQGGDGIYTVTLPFQPNRTLIRYRIIAADDLGASIRVPYADDPSLNFACFVYDGIPAYQGTPAATLATLPTYHFLTRAADYDQCVAYNSAYRLTPNTPSWTFENWEAAFIADGIVHDHIFYRLHGANGRYSASGVAGAAATSKRSFKFNFNKAAYFQGRDNDGQPYPSTWKTMITENCWENRATYTFSLNEVVNFYIWNALGVPAPFSNFAHFRTIKQSAEQPDPWHGDFWGLMFVHEDYDGQFLDAHHLPAGNLYKLTKDNISGVSQQRYQAPLAVKNGSDHDELLNNLKGTSTPAYITGRVNLDLWARYHAFAEAIRHYDYWPNGDNNAGYYFYPDYNAANGNKGVLWVLPSDVDATWGPTWNNGHDLIHNSLFNDAGDSGGDSATNPTLWPRYYNQVREIRDLLWQPEQINPLIDQFAAIIQPFVIADFARWYGAPNDAGNFNGLAGAGMSSSNGQTSLAAYVAGMKDFAFDPDNNGSAWPGGNVGVGGRAAFLDAKQAENGEGALIPAMPTLTYTGPANHPVNALDFATSPFSDPQGADTFGAIQWRVAQVNTDALFTPGVPRLLEIVPSFDSGETTVLSSAFRFPAAACRAGQTYRARVRHKDATGRWSHWSAPVEFTAAAADVSVYQTSLVISEFVYHPLPPSVAETAQGWTEEDFEYIELRNVSGATVDLTDVRLTKGVNFDFSPGTTLAAGANTLIVRNLAAFDSRYGAGKPIAGAWHAGDFLSNGGEEIRLSFGSGETLVDFTFGDAAPWPTEPDGRGYSLVLVTPEMRPNPALPQSWRSSRAIGGSPGGDDRVTFAQWATLHGVADPNGDNDGDRIINRLEYALGGDPNVNDHEILPAGRMQELQILSVPAQYLTLSFKRQVGAEDISYQVEVSPDLINWSATAVWVSALVNGDGTLTETWRAAEPSNVSTPLFMRLRISAP